MLRILQLEEIEKKITEASKLIDKYENRSPNFLGDVEKWFKEIEEILNHNRLAVASSIAGLRGALLLGKNGTLPSGLETTGRSTKRSRLNAIAIDSLNRALELTGMSIQGDRIRINEAERISLQLLSIARNYGVIKVNGSVHHEYEQILNMVISMKSAEVTFQGIVQLEGLLGQQDMIIMIDRLMGYGSLAVKANEK